MTRCSNNALIAKINNKKLTKNTEVNFAVIQDIDSCIKVNAKKQTSILGISAAFNQYLVPDDRFNCLRNGCKNTGTLLITTYAGTSGSGIYSIPSDATEYAAGAITYYVYLPAAGTYTINTVISDIADKVNPPGNTYKYIDTVTVTAAGFFPIVVDLSRVPNAKTGTGWTATTGGINLLISVQPPSGVTGAFGISSISIYDSLDDLQVNDTVVVGCLDEITGDITVDPADATCFGGGYDSTSITVEKTITAKSATPNYYKLNPLVQRGTKSTGWVSNTVEKTLSAITIGTNNYAYLQLGDIEMSECGFLHASIADNCNVSDALLSQVSTPVPLAIGMTQYILLDGTTTVAADKGKILFNAALVGKNILVSYPQTVEVEHFVANDSNLDGVRVRMSHTIEQNDGVKISRVYNNVLVTSFPDSITNEETTFPFTISVQRDSNGNFFEVYKIKQ